VSTPGEARPRRRGRSLRLKITVWFVLVFSAIQAGLIAAVVLARREFIRHSLEDDLRKSAESMVDSVLNATLSLDNPAVRDYVPDSSGFLLFAIRDETGFVISSWNLPDRTVLPFSAAEFVPSGPIGPVFVVLEGENATRLVPHESRLRLITLPFRRKDEKKEDQFFYFQAAVSDRVLASLIGPLDTAVLTLPLGILAATIAAWIIGGRAVAPIQALSRALGELSPRSLGARFFTRGTDDEIGRLEDELNLALERLEHGYRSQAQFISDVSHELKTPIAVLLTQAQVAQLGRKDPEAGYAFIALAEREMKRLGSLVESLLVLARTDLNKNRPGEPVSVNDLVLEAVQHCQVLADQHGVHLEPSLVADDGPEPMVQGDSQLLQVMLENLVRNAIRHSPQDAPVVIAAQRNGTELELAVQDHGPGIPPDYRERIFDRGVRVPAPKDAPNGTNAVANGADGGSGLGLAIARNVAQLHHGSIRLEDAPEGGSSFVITLPLAGPRSGDE